MPNASTNPITKSIGRYYFRGIFSSMILRENVWLIVLMSYRTKPPTRHPSLLSCCFFRRTNGRHPCMCAMPSRQRRLRWWKWQWWHPLWLFGDAAATTSIGCNEKRLKSHKEKGSWYKPSQTGLRVTTMDLLLGREIGWLVGEGM